MALVFFFVMKKFKYIWLLAIQSFFLVLSFILEISAFATAVQHPVLYNYEWARDIGVYNGRRLLYYGYKNYYRADGSMCNDYPNPLTDYCTILQYMM